MKFKELQPWIQRRYILKNLKELKEIGFQRNEYYKKMERIAESFLERNGLKMPKYEINSELEITLSESVISKDFGQTLKKILGTKSNETVKKELGEAIESYRWFQGLRDKEKAEETKIVHTRFGIRIKGVYEGWGKMEEKSAMLKNKEEILSMVDANERKEMQEQFIKLMFDPSIDVPEIQKMWERIKDKRIEKINLSIKYINSLLDVAYENIANAIVSCDFFGTITKELTGDERTEYKQIGINVIKLEK